MTKSLPQYHDFFNPVLDALRELGGSATNAELEEMVAKLMHLPESIVEIPHKDTNTTEVGYRIAWARTYLKKYGVIENSQRGVWTLTAAGRSTPKVDTAEVRRRVKELATTTKDGEVGPKNINEGADEVAGDWEDKALGILKSIEPAAFERLCQRLLRESGFIEVEVTGRSADGGIDGRGVLRIGGLISFTVMFQSKRYKDAVGSSVVRDFRGALMGRADKGLIITTGRFTAEANKEATRDGATPIDLIDGNLLVQRLRELGLGIRTRTIEVVEVDDEWFGKV
jgi:restriction system protein